MELDNLIKNVRDFFLSQYKLNDAKTFVAFEPLAHMISPDDFKFQDKFDATVAAEELSRISDKIPQINDVFVPDGINTLSQAYGSLINSIQFTDANLAAPAGKTLSDADKQPYIEKVANMKANAVRIYQSQASIEVPGESIYLTHGTPTGWWDTNSTIWTKKILTQTTTSPVVSQTRPSLFVTNKFVWKLSPLPQKVSQVTHLTNIVKNPVLVNTMNRSAIPVQTVAAAVAPKIAAAKPIMTHATATVATAPPPVAAPQASPLIQLNNIPAINKQTYVAINRVTTLKDKVLMNRTFGTLTNITTQEVKSNNFQMEFGYALISLDRAWTSQEVFDNAKLWYALGHKAGYFSTGEPVAENTGVLRAIPKAMIVVKDLTITAQWSDDDIKAAGSSLGFGAFNISGSHFNEANKNQLQAPGIQIVGWICEVTGPKIPFTDDPLIN